MLEQTKNIFIRAIRDRMIEEKRTAEDIIKEYPKLTSAEKAEIISEL